MAFTWTWLAYFVMFSELFVEQLFQLLLSQQNILESVGYTVEMLIHPSKSKESFTDPCIDFFRRSHGNARRWWAVLSREEICSKQRVVRVREPGYLKGVFTDLLYTFLFKTSFYSTDFHKPAETSNVSGQNSLESRSSYCRNLWTFLRLERRWGQTQEQISFQEQL